jgi:hypothetical protein
MSIFLVLPVLYIGLYQIMSTISASVLLQRRVSSGKAVEGSLWLLLSIQYYYTGVHNLFL